ncbi:DnaJ like subfamily C member 30, mitochondrial [Pseudolycoriella hygida]|uniref:DnaJ like subfamily C member 30, mitochondrial n=1 Tax=Pseudolycoriella hygida TaxID=35572 RepID=A0A9Q0RWC4_9DIPT|nr:DnaJ like subfamily C member 30, mitochondrial [Pseudolycoriella hygida]
MFGAFRRPHVSMKCGERYNISSLLMFVFEKRNFSTGNALRKSHYEILGLSPKATQVDVKAAYYNLSKLYHPDKNEGSVEAAEKFRAINAAYEILGNYKLRRLYDKGIVHTAGAQYRDVEEETAEVPDDAQTKFYKRHMKRTEAPHASGRTPIYDFDEWNSQHYGATFKRSQSAKQRYNVKDVKDQQTIDSGKFELIFASGMFLLAIGLYSISLIHPPDTDNVSKSTQVR